MVVSNKFTSTFLLKDRSFSTQVFASANSVPRKVNYNSVIKRYRTQKKKSVHLYGRVLLQVTQSSGVVTEHTQPCQTRLSWSDRVKITP